MAVCTQILLLKIHLFHSRTYFKPYLEIQIAVQNIEIKKNYLYPRPTEMCYQIAGDIGRTNKPNSTGR